jgi:hypothetical protein
MHALIATGLGSGVDAIAQIHEAIFTSSSFSLQWIWMTLNAKVRSHTARACSCVSSCWGFQVVRKDWLVKRRLSDGSLFYWVNRGRWLPAGCLHQNVIVLEMVHLSF